MKSEQFADYGQALTTNEYSTPEPKGEEVLIKIDACGVCHSDIHVWDGYFDLGGNHKIDMRGSHKLPFTLGHEIAGEVVACGDDSSAKIGEKVIVYPWIGCQKCPLCKTNQEHLCYQPRSLGIAVDGGFSDHVVVPHSKYAFPLNNLSPELGCTYACSGVTAYSAINQIKDLVQGRQLLIIGAGGVGLSGLAVAKALLDCEIIVADIDAQKRELALAEGADSVIDPSDKSALGALIKRTYGGVAAAVDFVGSDRSAGFGVQALNKGSMLVVVGLFGGAMPLSIPLLPLKAITIKGSFVGSLDDMHALMELVHAGKIAPIKISQRDMCCAQQTLEDLRDGKVAGRVVLVPDNNGE
ncbi:alcohol dehydrogenase [Alteromonas gilva]|uniref:Alcohol dehydrogenase n=1 Tax=Alteromonas gilva TaxID=2987522 RepID=A0ABT5KZG4_9ALTE|nr:alcohol dehydrogenase [Alteromonas gilva]MDC8830150.1 alcohol dehydrogenase [Alteromonas gilva]